MTGSDTLERPTPGAPIDPRIRARRIEVQRSVGRRRLQRLVDLGIVAGVAVAFAGALWSPLLDVDAVDVTGMERTPAAAVVEAAAVAQGDPLVTVDLRTAGERVTELPWIEQASLQRRLDGTISIAVIERTPIAKVGAGDVARLVDRTGRVLGPVGDWRDAAPVVELTGVGDPPAPGDHLPATAEDALALAERLADAVPGALATLDVGDLTGTLAQGGTVRFGATAPVSLTVRSLRTSLAQVDLQCLAVLDLRLPEHVVLTREAGCS